MTIRLVKKCASSQAAADPLAAIGHFHWVEDRTDYRGTYTREELYDFIKSGNEVYVRDPADPFGKTRVKVLAAVSQQGEKCVYTAINGQQTDHLLNLPDCEQ
ncbi:MAG: DUF3892 domain-containing protein [Patescibacteria group bacterium]|nr:DUF3892 domain-containing protein [Patescibacteria group bacterium]